MLQNCCPYIILMLYPSKRKKHYAGLILFVNCHILLHTAFYSSILFNPTLSNKILPTLISDQPFFNK